MFIASSEIHRIRTETWGFSCACGKRFEVPSTASDDVRLAMAREATAHGDSPRIASEAVNHPGHYGGDTTYEAIKVIMAWALGFNLGNAVKYICRAGKKDPTKTLEDLKKARFYLDYEIQEMERAAGNQSK